MRLTNDINIQLARCSSGVHNVELEPWDVTFGELCEVLKNRNEGPKDGSYFISGPAYKRANEYMKHGASVLVLDGDKTEADNEVGFIEGAPDPAQVHECLKRHDIAHIIYSSFSNAVGLHKWRCIVPCPTETSPEFDTGVWGVMQLLHSDGLMLKDVAEQHRPAQPWFFPRTETPDSPFYFASHLGNVFEPPIVVTAFEKQHAKKFDPLAAMNKVLTGENFHDAANSLIMRWVNKDLDADEIKLIAESLMDASSAPKDKRFQTRKKDLVRAIKTAVDKRQNEQVATEPTEIDVKNGVPVFPEDLFENWPDPWPELFKEFCNLSFEAKPMYITPVFLGTMGFLLRNVFLTRRKRRPQLISLTLAHSTDGKDINTHDVLCEFVDQVRSGMLDMHLEKLTERGNTVTADTSFLEVLKETDGEYFWLNTEATRIYQQLGEGGKSNAAVAGLQDKLNDVADGKTISGKIKVGDHKKGVNDPNVQICWLAQPDTVISKITDDIVNGGFLGRTELFLDMEKRPLQSTLGDKVVGDQMSTEVLSFFRFMHNNCSKLRAENKSSGASGKIVDLHPDALEQLRAWEQTYILDQSEKLTDRQKKLRGRVMVTAEKLYTVAQAVAAAWAAFKKQDPVVLKDLSFLFPYIQYQVAARDFIAGAALAESADPLHAAVLDIVSHLVKKQIDPVLRAKHMIRQSAVWNNLKNRTVLIRSLQDKNNARDLNKRVNEMIEAMVNRGELVRAKTANGKGWVIGLGEKP